MMMYTR